MINPTFNRTKIISTIGPSCKEKPILEEMVAMGVDVFRLNMGHGTHEEHREVIRLIREINKENNFHVCLVGDLQGPKLRIGPVKDHELKLKDGDLVTFTTEKNDSDELFINYEEFPKDVAEGDQILIDDGKITLQATETNHINKTKARVIHGGILTDYKGVNLPNTKVSLPSLTDKDHKDLKFLLDEEVEWIALSFVREEKDILDLKQIINKEDKFTKVIAKIEKPRAIENIDSIINATDGLMIARGDLGVEIPFEKLPMVQKRILNKGIEASKPVIIATQIMESMINSPKPTRAESNDVANAVLDRADALMLSGETSIGEYPLEVVSHMQKIIGHVEQEESIYGVIKDISPDSSTHLSDAICQNAVLMAHEVKANAILGMTKSGYTGFKISSHRPKSHVFIFSDNKTLLNTLNLVWGVRGFYYDKFISTDQTFEDVINILKQKNCVSPGDVVVNTASMPIHEKQRTNMIKVSTVT